MDSSSPKRKKKDDICYNKTGKSCARLVLGVYKMSIRASITLHVYRLQIIYQQAELLV